MNICVDFDDTLNFESFDYTKDYMPNHVVLDFLKDKEFYIVTARDDNKANRSYVNGFCDKFNLNPIDVYYTNRTLKGDLLVDLECDFFIDDNLQQLNDAKANGINSVHPDDLLTVKVAKKKDPKTGTGKKPKGSGRRLYTDENPKDTCKVSFTSASAIRETFSSSCFKSKPHARQSQIINLVHQRVRAAYKNAKDPKTKARLKRALNYAEKRKEQSKKKTERLKKKKAFISNNIVKFSNKNNSLLIVIHPESLLERDKRLFSEYLLNLKKEVLKFDKVLLFEFLPEGYIKNINKRNNSEELYKNFKNLSELENVEIIRDYDLLKSNIENISEYLIENENLKIYLSGGYQELCFRGACYNLMDNLKEEIEAFNHNITLYKPLIFSKKEIGNLSYPAHKTLSDDNLLQNEDAWFEKFDASETKEASFPFVEKNYSDFKIRKFSFDIDPEELVWHRDREDRYVEVLDGEGWSIQYDNEIPMTLELGDSFFIKKNSWHRVIKGNSDLIIKISEKPYHYRFENELGNEILVGVEETYDENKGVSFDAVKITMEGPDSISENTITYKEAEELRGVLTDFLEDSGIMESTLEQSNDARDYNKPTKGHKSRWSAKYKKSINCSNPKGFSQKQYCKRKKRGGKYRT